MDVIDRLRNGSGDFLLFGITPPKASATGDDLDRISAVNRERFAAADPDALVLYDIADEPGRTDDERPFPFLPTLDPGVYLDGHLGDWDRPAVVYRAVGKYTEAELGGWLAAQPPDRVATVLVGASSSGDAVATTLDRAYALRRETNPDLLAGAVVIPERHAARGDEHLRMVGKQRAGASFFVSQILYDVNAAKNLAAAYVDECEAQRLRPRPIVFTLSVCGSARTLDFLAWLGVAVPAWLQRDLRRAENTLDTSRRSAVEVAADVVAYCRRIGVPVALNVESVSSRRTEIEAAVGLSADLRGVLDR
ncbi:MAG: methylenetetrahydrofolate reductase [Gordonia sp. (in: high G+C Gram-positive bacteria)]|uniref:methylenetetrahydrofolate reductase n=1 Tax=Gordonia sp. (in: high G+C Gram-positive bacteria) TaxID=84139 RepID=UPI0039E6DB9F